ncbi:hypothetical protein PAMP_012616 [Pampus punctatissimus]
MGNRPPSVMSPGIFMEWGWTCCSSESERNSPERNLFSSSSRQVILQHGGKTRRGSVMLTEEEPHQGRCRQQIIQTSICDSDSFILSGSFLFASTPGGQVQEEEEERGTEEVRLTHTTLNSGSSSNRFPLLENDYTSHDAYGAFR